MKTAKLIREERGALIKQSRDLNDKVLTEKRKFTAEEQKQWDDMNAGIDSMKAEIDRLERLDALDLETKNLPKEDFNGRKAKEDAENKIDNKAATTEEERSLAFNAWGRTQLGMENDQRHMDAAKKCGMNLNSRELVANLRSNAPKTQAEARAQSTTGAEGGYTIPQGFSNELESAMLTYGGMREKARIVRTASGNALPWPTSNDTSNKGALLAENTQAGSSTDAVFGSVTFDAFKYTSNIILVSAELLQDSAFNLASFLGGIIGERLARIQNEHCTTGTGSSQPKGAVVASTNGKTAASQTAIKSDEIIQLFHSVDPSYRKNSSFMMHDNTLLALRLLKDGDGQYLWKQGLTEGTPDTLMGKPVTINQDMASTIATGNKTILFGDFSKYIIREVAEIRLKRLVERYADYDQEGFVGFMRFDGDVIDAGTHPLKRLTQA